ncbi:beta-Ala-His dipeptidase [bacterium 210820-DFI.6.37]|nr:beta-Ala-His dipeptidase [bacterium 210820-DFI.6.37]
MQGSYIFCCLCIVIYDKISVPIIRVDGSSDQYYNVLIRKAATPGYEDHPGGVILQAHMDMVCEKNCDVVYDFDKDPIEFELEGDKIIAKKTTLGADDGIGVALGMALLAEPGLKHPPLEFVCTTDEERGMTGIENFDFGLLRGDRVINLDNDEESIFVVGCAGGPVVRVELPVDRKPAKQDLEYYELTLRGLVGGHSGEDINKGRANANKLLVRVLMKIHSCMGFELANFSGGLKYNAIPRNAEAVIGIPKGKAAELQTIIGDYQRIFKEEYRNNDPDIVLSCKKTEPAAYVLGEPSKLRVLDYINFSQNGVVRMDIDYPQFVESSVSVGVVEIDEDRAVIQVMTRSSRVSQYEHLLEQIVRLTERLDGTYQIMSNCPAWEYDDESQLKDLYEEVYREVYQKEPSFMILHAGVEASEFPKHIDRKLEMISVGPDARNLHAPG